MTRPRPVGGPTRRVFALTLALLSTSPMASEIWRLAYDAWQRPRSAATVLAEPSVRDAVQAWIHVTERGERPARLVIHHPGGEDGTVWAAELRDWLVALAVPGAAIELRPGSPDPDALRLFIESR